MSPIQQMLLGAGGAVATKTYVDDLFATNLYVGDGANSRTITTGLDLSTKGGMTWLRDRGGNVGNMLFDTVRGARKPLNSENNNAESSYPSGKSLTGWTTTGFTLGQNYNTENWSGYDYVNWNFRKAPGFFDVVTYTGNGSARTIAHSLGSVPGMVFIKRTSSARQWCVWHKDLTDNGRYLILNSNSGQAGYSGNTDRWNNQSPTATHLNIGTNDDVNEDGGTYVAYIFAGQSFKDDAVQFDGGTEGLTLAATSDFHFGTDDFTIECFTRRNSDPKAYSRVWAFGPYWNNADSHGLCFDDGDHANRITWANYRQFNQGTVPSNARVLISTTLVESDRWYHVAVTRKSGVFRLFIDGKLEDTNSSITTRDVEDSATNTLAIGRTVDRTVQEAYAGEVSNFRVVNGQALYTEDFNPPGSPLTTTSQGATSSNVKLLCCQHGSATASSVTPGTITEVGSVVMTTARIDFAIDDDACIFGESGIEPVISSGSYTGNGSSTGPEIKLGWEPQWVLIKRIDTSENWFLWDSMRGIGTDYADARLIVHSSGAENDSIDRVDLTSTGFIPKSVSGEVNANGGTYIYMCMRRPDGYVGKPPELGTGVFAMDTGNTSTGIPNFDSGFIVDYALMRAFDSSDNLHSLSRLTGTGYLLTTNTDAESTYSGFKWDSNVGWYDGNAHGSTYQSWMWKRGIGMDVVCYKGNGAVRQISHGLAQTPEMIWIKKRNATSSSAWIIYHKGLNGGTNPENYILKFDTGAETSASGRFAETAPTSRVFTLGGTNSANQNTHTYISMLFASVEGISKIGYFSGDGTSNREITTGFQPRLLIIRKVTSTASWSVLDTGRGWTNGGAQPVFDIESANGQANRSNWFSRNSTSFTIVNSNYNDSSEKYIYYAHA